MIKELLDLRKDAELRGDVAVVGSGLAGTEAARTLAARGLRVVLLESGRRAFDGRLQLLNEVVHAGKPHRVYSPGADFHKGVPEQYRGLNRVRQFGGTSNSWTGKWRAFTQSDLAARPWIPLSEWPITLEELKPFYRSIAEDYGLGDVIGQASSPEYVAAEAALRPHGLKPAVHYWQAQTTRVASDFAEELEGSRRIELILGATVTEIVLAPDLRRVSELRCLSPEGRHLSVRASWVVLATGGLETARLLLASNQQIRSGVGNAHDLVGRYYIEHPKEQSGLLLPSPGMSRLARGVQSRPRPRFCMSFSLSDEVMTAHELLRHSIYLTPKYFRLMERVRRVGRGKSNCRDENGLVKHYRVKFATEQVPNHASRVYLGQERDALGMPRLVVDWRFTELDHRSIDIAWRQLKKAFAEAGLGELKFGVEPLTLDATMDAAHPMGTTRMASTPRQGVVDADCRVFDTENLFIASSAVFPTGAIYSPTYTIVALARRLAQHLASRHCAAVAPLALDPAHA